MPSWTVATHLPVSTVHGENTHERIGNFHRDGERSKVWHIALHTRSDECTNASNNEMSDQFPSVKSAMPRQLRFLDSINSAQRDSERTTKNKIVYMGLPD